MSLPSLPTPTLTGFPLPPVSNLASCCGYCARVKEWTQVWLPCRTGGSGNEAGFVVVPAAVTVGAEYPSIKPFPSLGLEQKARHLKVTRLLKLQRH